MCDSTSFLFHCYSFFIVLPRKSTIKSTFVATCVFVSLAALSRFSLVNRGSFGRVRTADLHPSRHQKGVTVQQLGYAASRRQYEFTFLAI